MAGRGRGRGRGSNVSFNVEQLGFSRGEALPGPVTQPPPLFPPLERKPLPLTEDVEEEYLLVVRKDLTMKMKNLPFYLFPTVSKQFGMPLQFNHRSQVAPKNNVELPVQWDRMPVELKARLPVKRKKSSHGPILKSSRKKLANPSDILNKLEAKEKTESDLEEEAETEGKKKEDGEEDEEEAPKEDGEEDFEEVDEELDEGTDYANAYFDNGENYLDEDDNIDDEPVY